MEIKKLLLLVTLILFLGACGTEDPTSSASSSNSGDSESGLHEVELLLAADGTTTYYAYIAQENGYFEDEGLVVDLVPGKGSSYVVQQVGAETVDIGITAAASLLPAWDKGIDIDMVYQINVTNLFDFMVPKDSNIRSIDELKGKAIGVSDLGGGEVPMVRSILSSAGLNPDQDVTLRAIGTEAPSILAAFDGGDIQAYSGGAHDLITLYARGFESNSLIPEEYVSLPSTAIIANGKVVEENPELVEGISRAIARATDFSINDPDAAFDIMKEIVPEQYVDEEVGRLFLDTFIELSTPIDPENGYGYIYRDSWEKFVEQFSVGEDAIVTTEINLDDYLNDSFLEDINDFE